MGQHGALLALRLLCLQGPVKRAAPLQATWCTQPGGGPTPLFTALPLGSGRLEWCPAPIEVALPRGPSEACCSPRHSRLPHLQGLARRPLPSNLFCFWGLRWRSVPLEAAWPTWLRRMPHFPRGCLAARTWCGALLPSRPPHLWGPKGGLCPSKLLSLLGPGGGLVPFETALSSGPGVVLHSP